MVVVPLLQQREYFTPMYSQNFFSNFSTIGEIGDFVEFHDNGNCKYFRNINESLKQIATELPSGAFVSAKGLCGQADNVHFDSRSYREFGKRYFAEYLKVNKA